MIRFTLRAPPDQRLDLSPLVPDRLTGLDQGTIERIGVSTTRAALCVGDVFTVRLGDPAGIAFDGGSERFDHLGEALSAGEIIVEGDVGQFAGRRMGGGRLEIRGDAGGWAASGMRGGRIEILGRAGERLGGPAAGELAGMAGGIVVVRGSVGERAGDRLRRGLIVVEGDAAGWAGSRMIAGTLVVCGTAGALPGYLMRRGTLLLGRAETLSPTFVPTGGPAKVFLRLLAAELRQLSEPAAGLAAAPLQRLMGDMATLGLGEMLLPSGHG